ncbi:MAG TPA: DUF5977 domain-containing protein, partial [Flavisolibacter sp.]|nr:DUF5977 domain-containing protein [Flavisolibacter sp.]
MEATWDTQPDMFSFNFNGYTGQFIFDEQKNIMQIAASNLKFEKDFSATATWNFKVTTPDGLQYFFGGPAATEKTKKETSCGKAYNWYQPTAWYLTRILAPTGEEVLLNYEALPLFSFYSGVTETHYYNVTVGQPTCHDRNQKCQFLYNTPLCYSQLKSQGVLLKSITSSEGGSVSFQYTTRYDCGDKLLESMSVADYNNTEKFRYKFLYQHVTGSALPGPIGYAVTRPFLTGLVESSPDNALTKQHAFSYNDLNGLPARFTLAQDHWGYFNGKPNTSLVERPRKTELQQRFSQATADRTPDYNFSKKGTLSKIEYPTGGWEVIHYGPNQYWGSPTIFPPPVSVSASVTGTGFKTEVTNYSSYFTIPESQSAIISYTVSANSGDVDPLHNVGTIWIQETSGAQVYYINEGTGTSRTTTVKLVGGKTYRIGVRANGAVVTTNAQVTYTRPSYQGPLQNMELAGVRVNKVEAFDGTGNPPEVKRYYYSKLDNLNVSSGAAPGTPKYFKTFKTRFFCDGYRFCDHESLSSYSLSNLSPYGSVAAYQTVVEGLGENMEGGAIEHTYRMRTDFPASPINPLGDNLDNAPSGNQSRYHGKELTQVAYQKTASNTFIPVKKLVYTYKDDPRLQNAVYGYTVNRKYAIVQYGPGEYTNMVSSFDASTYTIGSNWEYVEKLEETVWDTNGENPMTTTTNYFYDNKDHQQVTRTEVATSTGELLRTEIKYPADFTNLSAADALTQGVKALQAKGMEAPEIEKSLYRLNTDGTAKRLLSSTFTTYRSDNLQPLQVEQIERTAALTDFSPAIATAGMVQKDPRYKPQVLLEGYDHNANLLQQSTPQGVKQTYIWDYKGTKPVAAITNATHTQVAYTSFETENTGGWTLADGAVITNGGLTGKKYLSNGTLSKSLPATGNYILTLWTKGSVTITPTVPGKQLRQNGAWKLMEWVLAGGNQVSVQGTELDEVRLYPLGAQMQTLTYDPLIGATSQCDVNNRITYFEYDGLGRLSLVRDESQNILKKYCYNYQGQVEECGIKMYTSAEKQGTFTKACAENGMGSTYTYIVPAGTYTSKISQADADQKAQEDLDVNGPLKANQYGTCTWTNDAQSQSFTKQCTDGGTGTTHNYTITSGQYSSTISKADANQQALNAVNANGQAYANSVGTCTWTNDAQSGTYAKQCSDGGTGTIHNYTVSAGRYSSTVSKADANQKALNDVAANGQAYANQVGSCTWYNDAQSGIFSKQCAGDG